MKRRCAIFTTTRSLSLRTGWLSAVCYLYSESLTHSSTSPFQAFSVMKLFSYGLVPRETKLTRLKILDRR